MYTRKVTVINFKKKKHAESFLLTLSNPGAFLTWPSGVIQWWEISGWIVICGLSLGKSGVK